MKKSLLSGLVMVGVLVLTACTSSTGPSEAYRNESQQEIYQKGKAALEERSYSEAIKRFEALDIQYPYGPETESAQLYLIYAYYMKEEYPMASAAAERFIRLHPASPHVDYAYYLRGLSDYYQNMGIFERLLTLDLATRDLTQIQKSYNSFDTLVRDYPNSPYAPSAYQYLIYLRNMMADHELQVGEFYYSRKAYVAAVERASGVVAHFQGAPATKQALILMVKSYHQLGETKLEQDTLATLRYNYPNTSLNFIS